ncbi:carboxymuconolactone decarboxylase family protein, partial [Roseisolibacter sp. H3M3-2]
MPTPRRFDFDGAAPDAPRAVSALDACAAGLGLPPALAALVRLRTSQLNGCAYCVDLHAREARRHGESEARVAAVADWRAGAQFTPRERAALGWAETLTRLGDRAWTPEAQAELREHADAREAAALTIAVVAINAWNRLVLAQGRVAVALAALVLAACRPAE